MEDQHGRVLASLRNSPAIHRTNFITGAKHMADTNEVFKNVERLKSSLNSISGGDASEHAQQGINPKSMEIELNWRVTICSEISKKAIPGFLYSPSTAERFHRRCTKQRQTLLTSQGNLPENTSRDLCMVQQTPDNAQVRPFEHLFVQLVV